VEKTGPPSRVMRFYGNLDYAAEPVGFKEITFLHVDKLNDPFDPYFFFATDFNEDHSALMKHVQQNHKSEFTKFKKLFPQSEWPVTIAKIDEHLKSALKSTFVFSASEIKENEHPKDNLYLWSHYADGHRGAAIEFDAALLGSALKKEYERHGEKKLDPWIKIKYCDKVPQITAESIYQYYIKNNEHPLSDGLKRIFSTKREMWRIENEWRLVWRNDHIKRKTQRLKLIDNSVAALYLGYRIPEEARESLISDAKYNFPDVKLFAGKMAKGKFALEFDELP